MESSFLKITPHLSRVPRAEEEFRSETHWEGRGGEASALQDSAARFYWFGVLGGRHEEGAPGFRLPHRPRKSRRGLRGGLQEHHLQNRVGESGAHVRQNAASGRSPEMRGTARERTF